MRCELKLENTGACLAVCFIGFKCHSSPQQDLSWIAPDTSLLSESFPGVCACSFHEQRIFFEIAAWISTDLVNELRIEEFSDLNDGDF